MWFLRALFSLQAAERLRLADMFSLRGDTPLPLLHTPTFSPIVFTLTIQGVAPFPFPFYTSNTAKLNNQHKDFTEDIFINSCWGVAYSSASLQCGFIINAKSL